MVKDMFSSLGMIGDMLKIINVCFISAWEKYYDMRIRIKIWVKEHVFYMSF
jgi:hypothetical protein